MKILERYYLGQFLRTFLLICAGLTILMTLTWMFRGSSELNRADPGTMTLLYLAVLDIPGNMVSVMPISALVATLLTVGHASGAMELVAFSAGGGRLKRLMYPLIVTGAAISIASFMLSEVAEPACTRKSIETRSQLLGVTSKLKLTSGTIWLRTTDGAMASLGHYSRKTDSYHDVAIYKARDGRLLEVIRAREAVYSKQDGAWKLKGITIDRLSNGGSGKLAEMPYPYLPEASELTTGQNYTDRMGAFELIRYLRKLKAAGFKNKELVIVLHSRFASPMLNLIMVILGVAVAARHSLGALKATTIGVLVTALYWLVMTISAALGLTGVIPPFAATWLSPAIFIAAATALYSRIPE